MSDPVKVELVGGTAATNPWHDHRVMLVSPEIAALVQRAVTGLALDQRLTDAGYAFVGAYVEAPRVHADDDAIRWLTNRQGDGDA